MVVDFTNIFDSVREQIPQQDWTDESWAARASGTSAEVFRQPWRNNDGSGVFYRCYGEGDDPEQNPIVLELVISEDIDGREGTRDELEDRLEGDMKELIGWEESDEADVFMRKELPSDPLTILPRLLEEFKKLEVVSNRIDETLGTASQEEMI